MPAYDFRMQPKLMDILVCPMCKGDLDVKVEKEEAGEIITGTIICKECRERYPIEDGIPNMLPPDQRG
jgi:uncharacterized protein YbaR (Trm112 family)